MLRRDLLALALAGTPAVFGSANSAAAETDGHADPAKVVYHLADLDKVEFVLGNIRDHFDGMGGSEKVTIVLVVHGPALKAFHWPPRRHPSLDRPPVLSKAGLQLDACIHTMHGQNVTLGDLLPGFTVADKGGVVRLAELQGQGFVYLRP